MDYWVFNSTVKSRTIKIYSVDIMTSWKNTYYLPEEVRSHKKAQDCWVVIYHEVINITVLEMNIEGQDYMYVSDFISMDVNL